MNNERSGDIIVITDGREGYLTLDNEADSFRGWHGGPTTSESNVPLMFSMPGPDFVDDNGQGLVGLPEKFKQAIEEALQVTGIKDENGFNRNWHLTQGLSAGLKALRED